MKGGKCKWLQFTDGISTTDLAAANPFSPFSTFPPFPVGETLIGYEKEKN